MLNLLHLVLDGVLKEDLVSVLMSIELLVSAIGILPLLVIVQMRHAELAFFVHHAHVAVRQFLVSGNSPISKVAHLLFLGLQDAGKGRVRVLLLLR